MAASSVAKLAVLASGNGSNFQALVEALRRQPTPRHGEPVAEDAATAPRHECVLLVYDRKAAYAAARAQALGVPARYVPYAGPGRPREVLAARDAAEAEINEALRASGAELLALAGFMRLLSPAFVARWEGRIVNIHPSLLPAWPGADAIRRAFEAGERRFGVSVHFVDAGMDTGPLIAQSEFQADVGEDLSAIEARVHALEHRLYPRAVLGLLDELEARRKA